MFPCFLIHISYKFPKILSSICTISMVYIFTEKAVGWTCDFVGSYHKYQATNCCFSEDGSLLAVSFEEIVTIWDSETWELKCTFCQRAGKIRSVNNWGSMKYWVCFFFF